MQINLNTDTRKTMNALGHARIPFLFLIDFEMQHPLIYPIDQLPSGIEFNFNGHGQKSDLNETGFDDLIFEIDPVSLDTYKSGFDLVKKEIYKGNSFLLNLTFPTRISTNKSLEEVYRIANAKYKLKFYDQWIVYSPESFVKITNGQISTFPMKGTIDASIPDAEKIILNDTKEKSEHNTIVDLIRNDLSKVAKKVNVSRFRYIDNINTSDKNILQVSSEITGNLPTNYHSMIGDIMYELLPAGSISGAPKKKTMEIIRKAEGLERGYYTGVAAYFDGYNLDSCVLIRYMEQRGGEIFARSGGGITHMSNLHAEYQELIDKVYVPIIGNHKNSKWQGNEHPLSQPEVQQISC